MKISNQLALTNSTSTTSALKQPYKTIPIQNKDEYIHQNKKISFGQSIKNALNLVEIEINRHCNLKCPYCPNSFDPTSTTKKFINSNMFQKILSDLKAMKFSGTMSYHFFGEPLLNPDLEKFVELTKEQLPKVTKQIFTNGTLLSLKRFQSLLKAGVDRIVLTTHNKNNPFPKRLLDIPDGQLKGFFIKFPEEMVLSNRGGSLTEITSNINFSNLKCPVVEDKMVITVDGDVLPCYDDYFRKNKMGNVNNNTINEIWNSAPYMKFRDELAEKGNRNFAKTCENCTRTDQEQSIRHFAIDVKKELQK